MYQVIDNRVVLSVKDWLRAGLTRKMYEHDSGADDLDIFRRSIHDNTLIDVRSIKRPERLGVLEEAFGRIPEPSKFERHPTEADAEARRFFIEYRRPDGSSLDAERITECVNRASIFRALKRSLERTQTAYARTGRRLNMGDFWREKVNWFMEQTERFPCEGYSHPRALERAFKKYLNMSYRAFIPRNIGNDGARLVSYRTEKLLLALWTLNNKPFVSEVHRLYIEFVRGKKELFDRDTGELFRPEEFRYTPKGGGEPRPLEISVATVRNYLKDHINEAARASRRDGGYIAKVEKYPFLFRDSPKCSLSKVSMDDADLSRKLKGGSQVHRYMAFDVASGYWFTPVYSRDPLTAADVVQCFRNMLCELDVLGLPMIGEIEHEHHLVDAVMIEAFQKAFPFVTVSSHSRNKRAEHAIKSQKWGVAHRNGHVRGRFYGKKAFRTPKTRVKGDWKEKEYEYVQLVEDDLADIEEHNKSLHPRQHLYPGLTREEVFLQKFNRKLPKLEPYYLYRYIGNETKTTVRNNNHLQVNYETFLLDDFQTLKRMMPGDATVTAYWIPDFDGKVDRVYLYQNDAYIGSATNAERYRFNESKFEETEEDRAKKTEQFKRLAKFEKLRKDTNRDVPRVGVSKVASKTIEAVEVKVVEAAPAAGPADEFEMTDYSKLAEQIL